VPWRSGALLGATPTRGQPSGVAAAPGAEGLDYRDRTLAPARLEGYASGDLLSASADIDSLDTFYLRLLAPVLTALCASLLFIMFLWCFNSEVAWQPPGCCSWQAVSCSGDSPAGRKPGAR